MRGRPRKIKNKQFKTLGDLLKDCIDVVRPPQRLSISEASEKYRYLVNPGSYTGPWKNKKVPYMVEPMNCLIDRRYSAEVFVGPAQSGKTDALLLNWLLYSVCCDPADMIFYQTANTVARDFSKRRVDRLHRHSPEVGQRLIGRGDADNTFDKYYKSGMILTLSWPAINELSGRPVGRVALTDYDRMPLNIDGEGNAFDLARKRTTTFGSFAMTLAESSPGYSVNDPKFMAKPNSHEAPPAPGILSLYNRGDRRRWFWECHNCRSYFEPSFHLMRWSESSDLTEAAESAYLECPHCRKPSYQETKPEQNEFGMWAGERQVIEPGGILVGDKIRSDIASFWLKGPAAAFQKWESLVLNYLKAMEEFDRTGEEDALRTTVNTDQAEPYFPRSQANDRKPEDLIALSEDYGMDGPCVPYGVRFLYAAIDVQGNRFEVQVHGVTEPVTPGALPDHVTIDRFAIQKSERRDEDDERYYVKPHTHLEDWDLIIDRVIKKTYPLADDSGRKMAIRLTACDSGGKKGVTSMSYNFWRKLRREGLAGRFVLVKGTGSPSAPRINLTYPDADRKGTKAGARGEIPVLMIQTDKVKDELDHMLDRAEAGGMVRFSATLDDQFYRELTVEFKNLKGKWENPKKLRQEAWDLLVYHLALCHHERIFDLDWENPPRWATPWEENILVTADKNSSIFEQEDDSGYDLSQLGSNLG